MLNTIEEERNEMVEEELMRLYDATSERSSSRPIRIKMGRVELLTSGGSFKPEVIAKEIDFYISPLTLSSLMGSDDDEFILGEFRMQLEEYRAVLHSDKIRVKSYGDETILHNFCIEMPREVFDNLGSSLF